MSQAGILNIIDNNPSIPTQFDADTGFAVPLFNIINIVGGTGITTSAAGNTLTISFTGGGGFVTSVSGTANRITSTGGTTPVIDIAATYVGQTSITTLGTVTTGVWNGTAIGPTFGGTGQTTYTTGDTLYASAANTLSKLAIGSAGQVLTVTAGIPSWQTPTTGTVTSVSGTANRITSTGGATPVIDIAATYVGQTSITTLGTITTGTWNGTTIGPTFGGTGQTTYATGDILYASGVNTLAKLPAGTNGFVLTLVAGIPAWVADGGGTVTSVSGTANRITSTGGSTPVIDIAATYVGQTSITTLGTITTGVWNGTTVDATHGGTAQSTWATGDILYASGVNTLSKLAAGSNTQVLTLAAGVPSWATPTTGTVTSVSGTANRITSTGGATPVIDISAAYVGQTSITTLGTITTGVWNGTLVALAFGGTNANLTASNGGIFYSTATAGAILAGTATAGQILRSGATAAPTWSTATYPATAGTSGNVLTSDGTNWNSTAPAAGSGVNKVIRQVFTATGTYTPSAGMLYADIEVVGAGGGGGGAAASTTLGAQGGGGGGGGYARKVFTAATIGASQAVTIGAAGTAGSTGGGAGGTGGTTSVGALISATGGAGGGVGAAGQTVSTGGLGGVGSSGDFNVLNGGPGGGGFNIVGVLVVSGEGGTTFFGGGGRSKNITGSSAGNAGTSYGAGGSGGAQNQVNTGQLGGVGFAGIVIVTEYTT